ncbi:DUF4179 domain-containing protein [Tissierella praeacuta]|uniref:DUF4179 domain-containing protein n=1 Tax=Tissierella praeacuta TaxID=43131 RepID=UPI00333EDC48
MKKIIKRELDNIEIPKELHKISKMGIQKASLEIKKGNKMNKHIKKVAGVAAVFILSISLIVVNNPTLANSIKGFFKDITNWNGAITGIEYEQATEEVDISTSNLIVESNKVLLQIEVTFKDINEAPFNVIEALTIGKFKIIDSSGSEINHKKIQIEAISKEDYSFEIEDKDNLLTEIESQDSSNKKFKANLIINKEELSSGNKYILMIESFYGHKKAEAPIEIKGNWEVNFTAE